MPYTPPPDYIPPPDAKASGYIPPPDYVPPPDAVEARPEMPPTFGAIPEKDGSVSLIPTLDASGRSLSPEEAEAQYRKTGNKFGTYASVAEAQKAGQDLYTKQLTAPMMASHGQPQPVPSHMSLGEAAKQVAGQYVGSSARGDVGTSFDPRAIYANLGKGFYSGLIGEPLGMASKAYGAAINLGNRLLSPVVGGEAPLGSPDDVSGALEKASEWAKKTGESFMHYTPRGYEPGWAGGITQMVPSIMAGKLGGKQAAGAIFGSQMGNQAIEQAKAAGASPAVQVAMGTVGALAGGAYGMLRPGAEAVASIAPTLAERGAQAATGGLMLGGITTALNATEKALYNPSKGVLDAVPESMLTGFVLGGLEARGNPVTEQQANAIAKMARENPEQFSKVYKDVLGPVITQLKEQAPSERTPDQIRAELESAILRGDTDKAKSLQSELAPTPAHKHEGPIQLDLSREPIRLAEPPEYYPSDLRQVAEPIPQPEQTQQAAQPSRRFGIESGLGEQADTIDALNLRRQQLLSDIQSADEQAQQAARKRGPEGRRIAQKTAEGLRLELADVEQRITENTGKTPEEMGWENTKQAWENLKDEMKKPGGQRGAIGPNVDQMGGADIPGKVAELIAAGMRDGHRNASEWLASMRDKMSPEDFDALYRAVGGVQGANSQWRNNERASSMMDKPFTNMETGETFPLQTEASGNQVTTVGNRRGVAPSERPSATVTINDDGSLHLDGIDNKGQRGTGNEMFRKTVLAALNNGGDEKGVIHAEATPEAREMLSRYQGFKDDGRIVQIPTESVLDNKTNPEKMKFASAGLNPLEAVRDMAEAAKRELGLPEGATDIDLAHEVMNRIGRLGSSVKETVVRIMSKIKGIPRQVAQAIADHLHEAVSGSRESQLGAIGPDIKGRGRERNLGALMAKSVLEGAKKEPATEPVKSQYTPEEEAHYSDKIGALRDAIKNGFQGEELKAKRAELNSKLPSKASVIANYRKANAPTPEPTELQYRQTTTPREGSIPDAINQFLDQTVRRAFPTLVDQAGARAGDIARYQESKASTDIFKVNRNIRGALIKMMARPEAEREMIADAIESPAGKYAIADPKVSKAVDFVKAQSKEMGEALVKAGAIDNYVENYLHHAFKESPEQIDVAIKKKSPTGNLSYLIERHGPDTYAIAKELGLTPKETNPFKNFFDDFVNKQKFLVAHGTIDQLIKEGLVTKEAQPGYVRLNDYLRNAVSKSRAAEAGDYYAPKSVADLLNNHLGEGFERNIGFRALRAFNNSMNHVQLGLSFFHGMFIMRDISNTMLGSGITAMARGDFREGMRQLAIGATPIWGQKVVASSGSEMRSMMAGEKPTPPEMADVIRAYQLGGGHPELSPEYINDTIANMRITWEKAKDVKLDKASRAMWGAATVGQIPFEVVERFAKPIMEHLVPNAKAGAFRELWKVESKRLPPDATDAQKAVIARKLVNDIDDRMGQLIYNNLHIPNAMRQIITTSIRAGGWDIGSLRAIYGAGFDVAKAVKMLGQDVAAKAGIVSAEGRTETLRAREAQGIRGGKDYITQRMGYGIASAMSMAIMNGLLTYVGNKIHNANLDKGEKPSQEVPTGMDYVFPRIGKDRYSVAGYEKEAVEQYRIMKNLLLHHDPSAIGEYVSQKASPIVNLAKMLGTGRDWRGNEISPASAVASQYAPIAASQLGAPQGSNLSTKIGYMGGPKPGETLGRFVGVTPAPKKLIQSDAENKALDVLHEDKTPLSEQAANHKDFVDRMALYYKSGDMEVYNDAIKRGLLSNRDTADIRKKAKESDLLKGVVGSRSVPPDKALEIYREYATPEEQRKLRPIMLKKKAQARSRIPSSEVAQWRKDWSIIK